MKQKSPP